MKTTIWAAALTVLGAGAAFAQDGNDFRREFEKRFRDLEERFRGEREKLEKEFREKREKLMPRGEDGAKPRLEELVEKLIDRVDRLERRLNENFGEFGRALPKDFDFKRLRELMPQRFQDRDFRFEFRRKNEEPEEKKKVEKKKLEKKDDEKKKSKDEEEDNF